MLREHALGRALRVQIRFLAVLADVEAAHLVFGGRTQRHDEADELHEDEADPETVGGGRRNRDGLDPELAGIAVEQSVLDAVERLLREDARQQRADGSTNAMRGEYVERVIAI